MQDILIAGQMVPALEVKPCVGLPWGCRGTAVGMLGLMLYNKTPYRDLLQASNGPEDGPSSLMPVTWWGCSVCRSNGVHTFLCPVHGLGRGVHRE